MSEKDLDAFLAEAVRRHEAKLRRSKLAIKIGRPPSKYRPHQGKRECEKRAKDIAK